MSQSIEKIKKAYTASFEVVTSHAAAAPDYGRSAFDALQLSISAVERWQKHLPERAALTYQIISSGNVAPNVIPAFAQGTFFIATDEENVFEWVKLRLYDIVNGAAQMTGTSVNIEETDS